MRLTRSQSIAPRHPHPRSPIIRGFCYADINTRVQAQVFIGLIREPCVERADPIGILLRAYPAEKFHVVEKFAHDRMANADGIVKFSMIAAANLIAVAVEGGLKTHFPIRNVKGVGNPHPALDGAVAQVVLAGRYFYKGNKRQREKTAVVANEVHLGARCDVAKAGFSFDDARAFVLSPLPLPWRKHQLT